jgi:hypothetical protein
MSSSLSKLLVTTVPLEEIFSNERTIKLLTFLMKKFRVKHVEKGQLLEIHLLEKTARHQNLDCSTAFEQIENKSILLEST